jgi:hypothetical protein
VTGGKHCDGFVALLGTLLTDAGLPVHDIFAGDGDRAKSNRLVRLPGYFRPTKEWDLLVVANRQLLASIECKSQVGSFGNNANNRAEEAVGNAHDFLTAYREGAFRPSPPPWLGYFVILEESQASQTPLTPQPAHFPVDPVFDGASYAKRYEILCLRLVRERLYNAACLILSSRRGGRRGEFREPNPEIGFEHFAASLTGHVAGYVRVAGQGRRTQSGRHV